MQLLTIHGKIQQLVRRRTIFIIEQENTIKKTGSICLHSRRNTRINWSRKRSGTEGRHGRIFDLPQVTAGTKGAGAAACKISGGSGAEKCPEAALRHRAEAGTGRRRREASESAAIIHSKRTDRHWTPVCPFFICFSLNLAPQGLYRAKRWIQAPAECKVSHADRSPPAVSWISALHLWAFVTPNAQQLFTSCRKGPAACE